MERSNEVQKNGRTDRGEEEYRIISSYEMREEIQAHKEKDFGLITRIPSLDELIEGFRLGELIVISGPTKSGKTLLAKSLTVEFYKQNIFPLWFSYEETTRYFLASFPELPLFYLPRRLKSTKVGWVEKKINEAYEKYNTRVVFIDHLHYLFDMARVRNPSIEIGTVIRRLKSLAVERELVIFLLCHTRKGSTDRKLSYESIRDSSFVSQESDCVMMIARNVKDPESCEAILSVEFHRRTGVLNRFVKLKKIGGYLRELENKQSE